MPERGTEREQGRGQEHGREPVDRRFPAQQPEAADRKALERDPGIGLPTSEQVDDAQPLADAQPPVGYSNAQVPKGYLRLPGAHETFARVLAL